MPQREPSGLPITVAASHLRACASELNAAGQAELGELGRALDDVVAGQRLLSRALARLADRVEDGRHDALAASPGPHVAALAEVLQAAAGAFGYSADALAESAPLVRSMSGFSGPHTCL